MRKAVHALQALGLSGRRNRFFRLFFLNLLEPSHDSLGDMAAYDLMKTHNLLLLQLPPLAFPLTLLSYEHFEGDLKFLDLSEFGGVPRSSHASSA